MNDLLDTCVVSELSKPQMNPHVLAWMQTCRDDAFYLSVLTLGELRKGIAKLPDSRKKIELQQWFDEDLQHRFAGRILSVSEHVADTWGEMQARAELAGQKMPVIDSLIAATGKIYMCAVVTRNTDDMAASGVDLVNPWIVPLPEKDTDQTADHDRIAN
jgi:predicted nucleic acid-binding protein